MKKRKLVTLLNSKKTQHILFAEYSLNKERGDIREWHGLLTNKLWLDFPFYTNLNRINNKIKASLIISRNEDDE